MPGVRAKSLELLVFLAVHRDGATLTDIRHAIWPDIADQRAAERLSTCLSNLRSTIRKALDNTDPHQPRASDLHTDPIAKAGGRYRLDPAIVSVDWWDLLDGQRSTPAGNVTATSATPITERNAYPWLSTALGHLMNTEES
jgi:two-component SAPR family response regulator